jgi:hypothetical protein
VIMRRVYRGRLAKAACLVEVDGVVDLSAILRRVDPGLVVA